MKKYLLILFFCLQCWFGSAQTNNYFYKERPKTQAIKINILSGFAGTLNLSYEYLFTQQWSIQNGISYTQLNLDNTRKKAGLLGFQYSLDFRKYKSIKTTWNGRYKQYFIRFAAYEYKDNKQDSSTQNKIINYKENLQGISIGYAWGYQKTYRNKYLIDAFIGIQLSVPTYYSCSPSAAILADYKIKTNEANIATNGIGFRGGIKFGYLF